MHSVPPRSLAAALTYVRNGGRLIVPSYARAILITAKTINRFDAASQWLLKEEGEGYRLRQGKSSIYILPGQLCYD